MYTIHKDFIDLNQTTKILKIKRKIICNFMTHLISIRKGFCLCEKAKSSIEGKKFS